MSVLRAHRWIAVQLVLVLAVGLAGVVAALTLPRGTPASADTLRLVGAAGAAAAQAGSFRMEMRVEVEGGGADVEVKGTADIAANGDAVGRVELPDGTPLRFLASGRRAWFELPAASPLRLGGQRWAGFPLDPAAGPPVEDPLAYLSLLAGRNEVLDLGEDDVRDVPTRHYRAAVDRDALEALVAEAQGGTTVSAAAVQALEEARLDLWLSDDGLPRRLRFDAEVEDGRVRLEFELFDYGSPVVVVPPPAAEVVDVPTQQEALRLLTGR